MARLPFTIELSRKVADGTWLVVPVAKTFDMIASDNGCLEFEVPWESIDRVEFFKAFDYVTVEIRLRIVFPKGFPSLQATMVVAGVYRVDVGRTNSRARVVLQCIDPVGGWPDWKMTHSDQ